jgi:hypothetical protein
VIYSTHGSYSGRRIGGKMNRLEDLSTWYDADIYLMGHTHELAGERKVRYAVNTQTHELKTEKKVYAFTGTYLRSHQLNCSSYAERLNLAPNKIGMITIEVNTRTRDIHVKE